jgi:hypothetical protein
VKISSLADELYTEAIHRGMRSSQPATLDIADIFVLVRDMPYARPSDREVGTLIREWRGTCSGKHDLLWRIFRELGYQATLMACTTELKAPAGVVLPPELAEIAAAGPIKDVHNYLILHSQVGDMIVDATWPVEMKKYGLAVNEEFVWGKDMHLACRPITKFAVPETENVHAFKARLLKELCTAEELARRDTYIKLLGQKLAK